MLRFRPTILVFVGLALVIGGFLWFAIFAGIPYQDPSPEQAARYKFHNDNSFRMQLSGMFLLAVASVWGVARWGLALSARRRTAIEPVDRAARSRDSSEKRHKRMKKNKK